MSEVNITSDLTPSGTKVTIDGKAGKGQIKSVYFSLDYCHPMCCCHCSPCSCELEPIPQVTCSYTVEEKADDGTEKCTTYRISKRGDEDAAMDDFVVTSGPSAEEIIDFLKKKIQGKI